MKAVLLRGYGGVDQLQYGEAPRPSPGPGEVLVKVVSTSVNPIDYKLREGAMKGIMPLEFPFILGRDVAGTVEAIGEGVNNWKKGDRVLGLVNHSYAEYLVAKATDLAAIPDGMKAETAGVLPLVLTTGAQLIENGVQPQPGWTVLVTGAVGSVGRTAVFVARQHGAKVIAGVRASQRAEAEQMGVELIAIDSDDEIAKLGEVDAIADTVNHDVIEKLLPHLRKGGRLGTVLGKPKGADGRAIEVGEVWAKPDAKRLRELAEKVFSGELVIPVAAEFPLPDAGAAQRRAEQGANGKVLITV